MRLIDLTGRDNLIYMHAVSIITTVFHNVVRQRTNSCVVDESSRYYEIRQESRYSGCWYSIRVSSIAFVLYRSFRATVCTPHMSSVTMLVVIRRRCLFYSWRGIFDKQVILSFRWKHQFLEILGIFIVFVLNRNRKFLEHRMYAYKVSHYRRVEYLQSKK